MPFGRNRGSVCALLIFAVVLCGLAQAAQYDPPADYYDDADGTGTTLKGNLQSIISVMRTVSYDNARYSAPITDADPNVPGNILLIYNRASVKGAWVTNPLVWNREHIWPQSRLGSASVSDQFNLRPANETINSTRGNRPFGLDTNTGSHGTVGSTYYYPGDADAGDVARSQFYMATRWNGLTLTDGTPSGSQMGDLSSLLVYHFRDVPDTFERRRNHAIYGLAGDGAPAITNQYRQENRNPYVDHPEWVWSVFANQQNDSQLYVGNAPNTDGSSTFNLNMGRVMVGAAVPAAQNVTLKKNGLNGTYYEVTASGAATSSVTGRLNAFQILTSGTDSRAMSIGLNTTTSTAGQKLGTVTINNLDITTAGGAGRGNNDENDTINVSLDVVTHANPSFSPASDQNTLTYDFGTVTMGSNVPAFQFDIANLFTTAGFTARLDLDSIMPSGNTTKLTTNLAAFTGANALTAGQTKSFTASINTTTEGVFSASYVLNFSDENIAGATGLGSMTLNLTGTVEEAFTETADFDGDGDVDGRDFLTWQRGYGSGTSLGQGDANGSGSVNGADLLIWQGQYDESLGDLSSGLSVPEPTSAALGAVLSLSLLLGRNRRT